MNKRGFVYDILPCDPDLADTAEFCKAYGFPLERSANAILVASRRPPGHDAVCLVLAVDRLDVNGAVRRKLGVRKVSFASTELTRDLTGQEIGGVTIFGLPPQIPVWVDAKVLEHDWVIVGAGSRSAKIRLDPTQLVGQSGVEIVEGLSLDR